MTHFTAGHSVVALVDPLLAALLGALMSAAAVVGRREWLERRDRARAAAAPDLSVRYRELVDSAADPILVVDPATTILFASPAFAAMTGGGTEGTRLTALVHPDDVSVVRDLVYEAFDRRAAAEFRVRGAGGHVAVQAKASLPPGRTARDGVVVSLHDVSERRALEQRLHDQRTHDLLTGLPNRAVLRERLEVALAVARFSATSVALVVVDLDDIAAINDLHGQARGDELIASAARRIRGSLREDDVAARVGGDEFAVVLPSVAGADGARVVAERILGSLAAPLDLGGTAVRARASVGVAVAGPDGMADDVLRDADIALWAAKARGKGQVVVFDPEMAVSLREEASLREDLALALERDELVLEYQPIHRITEGAIVGVEALLRWDHPARGRLQPGEFVPLAERTGDIVAIGAWVLREACVVARGWAERYPAFETISVNVSPRQLQDGGLPRTVAAALTASGLAPSRLVLELTETALLLTGGEVARQLEEIRAQGVRIALDDFGTGYSSLAHLHRYPIDVIKIDRTFTAAVGDSARDTLFARAILSLAQAIGADVVAEGVEEERQAAVLRQMGCTLAQGFLFARPAAAAGVAGRLGALRPREVSA